MAQASRISEMEQTACEGMSAAQEWTADMVKEQPVATLCTVFAAGMVVGMGAVALLSSSMQRPKGRFAQMEGLSQRIADAVCNAMPHQLSDLWQK